MFDEALIRAQCRTRIRMGEFLDTRARIVTTKVLPTQPGKRSRAAEPWSSWPDPGDYVRWLCESGFLDPFAYLRDTWVWRPVLQRNVAGASRASDPKNVLVFDQQTANILDGLEEQTRARVKRTGRSLSVEVVVMHPFQLKIAFGRIRWRSYDVRRGECETAYVDIRDFQPLAPIVVEPGLTDREQRDGSQENLGRSSVLPKCGAEAVALSSRSVGRSDGLRRVRR